MNPLTTLMTSLNSVDQAVLLGALEALANAATVATAFRIDAAMLQFIKRVRRPRNNPVENQPRVSNELADIMQRNTQFDKIIGDFDNRILELEKAVFLPQIKGLAIHGINNVIQNHDNINLARLAIQEAILSGIQVVDPNNIPAVPDGQRQNRFLYLASNNYADSLATLNFAIHDNFLWRSYFANQNPNTGVYPAIAHVQEIRIGDILVLAFRENGHFRILSPLVVTTPLQGMTNIAGNNGVALTSPFVSVLNTPFTANLATIGEYVPDPRIGRHTGLPVKLLNSDLDTDLAQVAYNNLWPSPPGNNAIWTMNGMNDIGTYYLPQQLRNWMATL
jgi:hypothetical protein